jgi:hypothetical protein
LKNASKEPLQNPILEISQLQKAMVHGLQSAEIVGVQTPLEAVITRTEPYV